MPHREERDSCFLHQLAGPVSMSFQIMKTLKTTAVSPYSGLGLLESRLCVRHCFSRHVNHRLEQDRYWEAQQEMQVQR